jgi:siroheme synthase-like protein
MDHPWFPIFIDLSDKNVLVVGAGTIAGRRAATLTRFCRHVEVIAPGIGAAVQAEADAGRLTLRRRPYEPGDLEGRDMVLAATDDPALNAAIVQACRARGIPVNASSDRTLCDFYFPGVVVDGDVTVGITAGGRDHRRAAEVTRQIREALRKENN